MLVTTPGLKCSKVTADIAQQGYRYHESGIKAHKMQEV